jgi:hypothetical protein
VYRFWSELCSFSGTVWVIWVLRPPSPDFITVGNRFCSQFEGTTRKEVPVCSPLRVLHGPRCIIPHVGTFTEEKSCVCIEFPTARMLVIEIRNWLRHWLWRTVVL